jgi:hypothetical protein
VSEDWDELARTIGYSNEKDMLEDFYLEEEMSVSEIARRLGAGTATIARRLSLAGVEKRSRGGANNLANQRRKLFHMDQRISLLADLNLVAKLSGASRSTCYKYRRIITGGKAHELQHYLTSDRTEPVFQVEPTPPGLAPSNEPNVPTVLPGPKVER